MHCTVKFFRLQRPPDDSSEEHTEAGLEGGMEQLIVCAALSEDRSLIPGMHTKKLMSICNSSSTILMRSSDLCVYQASMWLAHILTCRHSNT